MTDHDFTLSPYAGPYGCRAVDDLYRHLLPADDDDHHNVIAALRDVEEGLRTGAITSLEPDGAPMTPEQLADARVLIGAYLRALGQDPKD